MNKYLILCLLLSFSASAKIADPTQTSLRWRSLANDIDQLQPGRSFPFAACFQRAAEKHQLPLTLLLAVARGESDFNPKAVSSAGALGLMQILWPGTARHLGIEHKRLLYKPCVNVDAGARYLKELLQRYDGDLHLSLAAYNYGPGRITPGASVIPKKAAWYSGYILRHLDYVLKQPAKKGLNYAGEGRLDLIRFARPYRAEALVQSLVGSHPKLRLDVFRQPKGDFHVVLLFADARERRLSLRVLQHQGIKPL